MRMNIENIEIDKGHVLKFLGYGKRQPPQIIMKKIDEEIGNSKDMFEPEVFLKHFQIDGINNGEVDFGGAFRVKSDYAAEKLKDASSIFIALYTVGNKVETRISEYSNGHDMIRAMILDKIGVVALDNVNCQIRRKIINENFPFKISSKLYPGQEDFDLSNQKMIFEMFQDENDTITISKHYQLHPLKTVAVLFVMGKNEEKHDMCDSCNVKCFERQS
jgi:hypothetical protein